MSIQSDIKEGLIQITKSKPMAYQVLRFLVDNNCVLKVDRELPTNPNPKGYREKDGSYSLDAWYQVYDKAQQDMLTAGYVVVENLIEEHPQ